MGLFGIGKKKDIIDLGERYRKQKEKEEEKNQGSSPPMDEQSTSKGTFDFLGGLASGSGPTESSEEVVDISAGPDKRKRLAKRIMDMTSKMEDLSNQIYHLQQRIEVLERKLEVNRFD
jgi:hypothetical protein